MKVYVFGLLSFFCVLSGSIWGASSFQLPDMFVSESRFPISKADISQPYYTIYGSDIQKLGRVSIGTIVNTYTPFYYRSNGGGTSSIFANGLDSNQVKILVDGVEIKDAIHVGGNSNMDALILQNIDRIEVLSGNQSTLYGTDANGGVIAIFTQSERKGLHTQIETGHNYQFGHVLFSHSFSNMPLLDGTTLQMKASLSRDKRQSRLVNTSEKDGNNLENYAALIRKNFGPLLTELSYRQNKQDIDIDNSFSALDDPNYTNSTHQDLSRLSMELNWKDISFLSNFDHDLISNLILSSSYISRDDINLADSKSDSTWNTLYRGLVQKAELLNRFSLMENTDIILGLEFRHEEASGSYTDFTLQHAFGAYGQLSWKHPLLSGQVNVRQDHYRWALESDTAQSTPHFTKGIRLYRTLPNIDSFKIVYGYQDGYRHPSLYQQAHTPPTKSLIPEQSNHHQTGVQFTHQSVQYHANYFTNLTRNKVTYDSTSYAYYNADSDSKTEGIEMKMDIRDFVSIDHMGIIYTYLYHKFSPIIPSNKISIFLTYNLDPFSLSLRGEYLRHRKTLQSVVVPNATVFHFTAYWNIAYDMSTYISIENLLNEDYVLVDGYATLGRSASVGFQYQL